MKSTVREESGWKRILEIEVPPETVAAEEDQVLDGLRKRLNLPGFRKGKVPKEIARKYLADDLREEVLRRVLPRAFEEALRENDIHPVGDPAIQGLDFEPGKPLTFTAQVEIAPRVEISGYQGLKVNRVERAVEEEAVERTLDRLLEERATLQEADKAAGAGDAVDLSYVELDAEGNPKKPGEDPVEVTLEVGSERTPDVFNRELEGMKAGDRRTIPLEYPEDYPDEALAGTVRNFDATVKRVREKVRPALDDALAKEALGDEEATVETLRERIRENLRAELEHRSGRELEQRIVNRLLEINPFDLPEGVVAATLDRVVEQARRENPTLSEEEARKVREQYRPMVEGRYRVDILMDAVARQESIEVTDAEVDERIGAFAESEGRPAAKIKAELKKEGGLERLRQDLFQRKVLEKLTELADVTVVAESAGTEQEKK